MSNYKSYSDKLKDPRWQKKRLQILERDEWRCRYCYNDKEMLSVHHKVYTAGKEPWEYDDDLLVTLCNHCHEQEHECRPVAEQNLLRALKQMDYQYHELQLLAQAIIRNGSGLNKPSTKLMIFLMENILTDEDWNTHIHPTPQKIEGLK